MRAIETIFRGKDIKTRKWVYGYLIKIPSAIQMPDYDGPWYIYVPPVDPDDNGGSFNVDPDTVGRYTGVKDKYGNRIFEGDLLHSYSGEILRVFYEFGGFYVGKKWQESYHDESLLEFFDSTYTRVIGNIHDNSIFLSEYNKQQKNP